MHHQKKTAAPVAPGSGGQDQWRPRYSKTCRNSKSDPAYAYRYFGDKAARRERWQALPEVQRVAWFRGGDIERLLRDRFGPILPIGAMEYLIDSLNQIPFTGGDVPAKMAGFCRKWAPWLPEDQAKVLIAKIAAKPQWLSPDELAQRWRVYLFERIDLGLRTVGCWEMDKETRERFQRIRKNRKRRSQRKAKRKVTLTEQAKVEGVHRVTLWRRQKRATKYETNKKKGNDGTAKCCTPSKTQKSAKARRPQRRPRPGKE